MAKYFERSLSPERALSQYKSDCMTGQFDDEVRQTAQNFNPPDQVLSRPVWSARTSSSFPSPVALILEFRVRKRQEGAGTKSSA
jgi:hypothetical protein